MKILYYCLCIFLLLPSCLSKKEKEESQAGLMLRGEHELRKMNNFTSTNSKTNASFFLISSNFNQEKKEDLQVKFAWKMNDGTYAISSLPLEKIRIKFDPNSQAPVIKFKWIRYPFGINYRVAQTQELMDKYVCYAVLVIREEDWPTKIHLPLNE
jgi:hypothetical protein